MIGAIQTLRKNMHIVIMVSHRPEALAALNMAAVLRQGRLVAFGPRDQLFASVARTVSTSAPGSIKPGDMQSRQPRATAGAPS